jgi:rhamnose transport system ATP-binding protein
MVQTPPWLIHLRSTNPTSSNSLKYSNLPEGLQPALAVVRGGFFFKMLKLSHLSKSFPGVRALHDVGFELAAGEVTALIGENGAGKSTVVKLLTGIYRPDAGSIEVNGTEQKFIGPADSWRAGITAIHQETAMFDELTVAENIFMGHAPRRQQFIDWRAMHQRAAQILKSIDSDIDPAAPLKHLGVAQKHLVSIARALSHDSRIVIMDEPTASLSAREIDELFRIVDRLKKEGRAILFISHKFDEIFRVADRWVCLRDGEKVGEGHIKDVTQNDLVKLMVGRSIDQIFPKRISNMTDIVFDVSNFSNASEFADISFSLRKGEILGFYGLVGAGRSEVMQALFGISKAAAGQVKIKGETVSITSPAHAIALGLSYVPEDRQVQGAILPMGVRENTTLASLGKHVRGGLLSRTDERKATRSLGHALQVKASSWDQRIGDLSGGNQQKVVIAKWLAADPAILILDEPTKGIDIGSKAAVHELIAELSAKGLAIILVSSELPEVMGMSDNIIVMQEGRIVARFAKGEATREEIVAAATGATVEHAA